ncbi:MAG: polyribonucleotide nucleotidyltransferase, partial [Candidatus Puniceispirillales bacterium]
TTDGVLMVESEASELSEEIMLGAVDYGHNEIEQVIKAIIDLAEVAAKEPRPLPDEPKEKEEYLKTIKPFRKKFEKAYKEIDKSNRSKMLSDIRNDISLEFGDSPNSTLVSSLTKDLEADIVRGNILKTKKRIDGRDTKTVRPIVAEVGTLPRAHGSALFTRGETQALVVATLGTGQDEQIIDALEGEYRSKFMLHYNFPPYSVGEAGRVGSPGRREVGHGKLAWRAVNPLLPLGEDFPYTVRIVSEVTESNGSSSMATVCGTSLALMDAGVPIKKPVAGIAMGLIKEKKEFSVLSDILGDEDHLGDMDFKVAGTEDGITSLQMDIKITSITKEIMEIALDQAKEGRIHILNEMSKAIGSSREALADSAPKITTMKVKLDKIRDIIGPGGKMIREICETTGAKVDIEDDGTIKIAASDTESSEAAQKRINDIVAEAELGVIYTGKVVKTVDFGAFVNFLGTKDGLVHISELQNARTEKTTDICKEGDEVKVKVIGFDDRGKVKLSMKRVNQDTGEDIENKKED